MSMRVEILTQRHEYDGHFRLVRYGLRFEQFDGRMSLDVERLVFERGDSVAVLLYDPSRRVVTLVEQFRLPAYLREPEAGRLLEIVAGTLDDERPPDQVVRAEALEEAGYLLRELQYVTTFYPSPGAGTERIHLYLSYVSAREHVSLGGGLRDHGEDTRLVELPLEEALRLVREGTIRDAKTIIALQHLSACCANAS